MTNSSQLCGKRKGSKFCSSNTIEPKRPKSEFTPTLKISRPVVVSSIGSSKGNGGSALGSVPKSVVASLIVAPPPKIGANGALGPSGRDR